jgi:hypothetical protein
MHCYLLSPQNLNFLAQRRDSTCRYVVIIFDQILKDPRNIQKHASLYHTQEQTTLSLEDG